MGRKSWTLFLDRGPRRRLLYELGYWRAEQQQSRWWGVAQARQRTIFPYSSQPQIWHSPPTRLSLERNLIPRVEQTETACSKTGSASSMSSQM